MLPSQHLKNFINSLKAEVASEGLDTVYNELYVYVNNLEGCQSNETLVRNSVCKLFELAGIDPLGDVYQDHYLTDKIDRTKGLVLVDKLSQRFRDCEFGFDTVVNRVTVTGAAPLKKIKNFLQKHLS